MEYFGKKRLAGRPPRLARRSIAQWEKDFYVSCSVPWERVVDAQSVYHRRLDASRRVAAWDDSAAVAALRDCKKRYWTKINGLPARDVPLPDPDMYTGAVDQDAVVDPALAAEYEAALHAMEVAWEKAEEYVEKLDIRLEDIQPQGWADDDDCDQ